jgi:class 3 adenylate cyclase
VDTRTFASGVVLLTYRPTDQIATSPYAEAFTWADEQMGSLQAAQSADRVLASILFTDIVDPTGRAAALGDVEWRRVLDRHDRAARADVERFHGRFVKTTGDGILATFDTPTRALRCAFEVGKALADQGIGIRAAIHTGEIDIGQEDVAGIGVHIAARALAEAGEGQVIVTRTVKDLATEQTSSSPRSAPWDCVGYRASGSSSRSLAVDRVSRAQPEKKSIRAGARTSGAT